jgi:hypothetical protein
MSEVPGSYDMLGNAIALGALLGIAALALGASAAPPGVDPATRRDLEALARRSILFGHMSVGMELLDGLQKLAAREGVALRVVGGEGGPPPPPASAAPSTAPSTLSHLFLGNNGDAPAKLDAFSRALASSARPAPDIALVKFCYVDFATGTDAHALFSRYQATVGGLRSTHPETTFVHVTAPLSAVQAGPKAWAKRLLGKTPYGFTENARREEFNALVRRAYAGRVHPPRRWARHGGVEGAGPSRAGGGLDGRRRSPE